MKPFNLSYGIESIPEKSDTFIRRACKAVILKDNCILLIHTNKGDLKFPGGGVKSGESSFDCLKREISEETGYGLISVGELVGTVSEKSHDKFENDKYFCMESEYFLAEIDDTYQEKQSLDEYEEEQDFKPIFIDINEAIKTNQNLLDKAIDINPWVQRETDVLRELINR